MQTLTDEEIILELKRQNVSEKYFVEGISAVKNCIEATGWDLERAVKLIAKYAALND
jgi:hypothetical protein